MGRRPRWMKGTKARMYFSGQNTPTSGGRYITGGIISLIGAGIILAAIPGWVYLMLLGMGFLACGLFTMRS